jgi:DNA invertase Pin-like site-specific DNA recombinase
MEATTPLKYCLYARKSSESDERQAMSIDSQIKEMQALAEREGLLVTEIKRESHSAKLSGSRPVFMELIQELREGKFNAILTWAPDRMSRNAGDLGSLVDLMDAGKLAVIRTQSQTFTNNPNEKFLLMILCSQAKLENDNRAINVKRGIRAKCEMGWRPCMPPIGYFTRASTGGVRDVIIDEDRAPYIIKMFEMSAAGKSGRHIKQWLIDNNITTRKGKEIPLSIIYKILGNTFYYGEFEYPKGSGKWYTGKHESLITRELYEEVRKQLMVPLRSKWGAKEFPFKQFLKCGSCGAAIVGEEKFKKLRNGEINRHIYYHCSRQVNYDCPEPYARAETIINELTNMCNDLIRNVEDLELGLRKAINKFGSIMVSSGNTEVDHVAEYVKYVLREGSLFEQTRLIRNLDTNLTLTQKRLVPTR